jgi:hypothetical protein
LLLAVARSRPKKQLRRPKLLLLKLRRLTLPPWTPLRLSTPLLRLLMLLLPRPTLLLLPPTPLLPRPTPPLLRRLKLRPSKQACIQPVG